MRVSCKDGSVYEADVVLVTCSLGFLKHNADDMFTPLLPQKKREAIRVIFSILPFFKITMMIMVNLNRHSNERFKKKCMLLTSSLRLLKICLTQILGFIVF